ncbi:MAG: hypothetical protein KF764_07525 [Labilithrix sp.]|nr:hypothetical protein [Labilithrix sp.]
MIGARSVVAAACVAGALVACTLTRPLDYLTSGAADGGVEAGPGGGLDGEAPAAEPVAEGQFSPKNLVQDADNLFWSNADGAIMTAPKQGGEARKIVAVPAGTAITWLAADRGAGGDLFVIAGAAVQRVPKAGGALTLVEDDVPAPRALAVDDDAIFVVHAELNATERGFLARYARDGTKRALLSIEGDDPAAVALHGDSVFWAGNTIEYGAIFELPKSAPDDAGGAAVIHRGPGIDDSVYADTPEAFVVDDEAIYFNEADVTFRLPRAAGSTPAIVFEPPEGVNPVAFAYDGANLYVADQREKGSVIRIPKGGGAPLAIVSNLPAPTSIAVDASAVYVAVQGSGLSPDGAVLRIAK